MEFLAHEIINTYGNIRKLSLKSKELEFNKCLEYMNEFKRNIYLKMTEHTTNNVIIK